MKLQSMTSYVLEEVSEYNKICWVDDETANTNLIYKLENYAKFLTMPLELWMFVPVDKDGNVLEEPELFNDFEMIKEISERTDTEIGSDSHVIYTELRAYQKALSNVLFEGFEKCDRNLSINCIYNKKLDLHIDADFKFEKTIEDLVKYNLTLTENALKEYGL